MTDHERDAELFGQLGAAWRNQPVPSIGGDVSAQDAVTQRTVKWLALGWANLPVPAARLPARISRRRFATAWRTTWPTLAAAAVLVLMLTVPLLQREGRGTRTDSELPPSGTAEGRTSPITGPTSPVAHVGSGMELRSGPVRLLLLNPTITPPIEDAR
jgi:hypothetical protein